MDIVDLRFQSFSHRQSFLTIEQHRLMLLVIYALCLLLTTLTSWYLDSLKMVLNLLEKWFSMRTHIDYVTFEEPRDFLLDSQNNYKAIESINVLDKCKTNNDPLTAVIR